MTIDKSTYDFLDLLIQLSICNGEVNHTHLLQLRERLDNEEKPRTPVCDKARHGEQVKNKRLLTGERLVYIGELDGRAVYFSDSPTIQESGCCGNSTGCRCNSEEGAKREEADRREIFSFEGRGEYVGAIVDGEFVENKK